ncbi:ABC transporter permease [Paraburkholderia tropica]|uniref:ABC transporter permease n=1 Tax=Paraburkholderia tropica TaxID=92647 RepID=UPI002AB61DF4|nr:ABC transporter permease [Paraburkholderia tropica]
MTHGTARASAWLYPSISIAIVLLLWQAGVAVFDVPDYVLPSPLQVARTLVAGFRDGSLWPHIFATLLETLTGYAIGSVFALASGALLAESITFERFVMPLLSGLQAMPKVALAPLILVWCGYGLTSKVVVVALVCFFPLFINTVNGLKRADADLLDTCRAFSASRAFLFFHVKLPSAAPEICSGLQIGISLALIGAVVAEFISSQRGLGFMVTAATVSMNGPSMFSGVVLLAVLGVGGTRIVQMLRERLVFWEHLQTRTVAGDSE